MARWLRLRETSHTARPSGSPTVSRWERTIERWLRLHEAGRRAQPSGSLHAVRWEGKIE